MGADEQGGGKAPRYTAVAITLHWLIAAAFAFQIGLGWRMGGASGPRTFAVYQLHKSVGITILLLTLARVGWRLHRRPPPFPAGTNVVERRLAQLVHLLFYLLLLGLPLSGWLLVSSSRVLIPTYLYGTLWWPHLPAISGLSAGARHDVNEAAATTHAALGWISLGAIGLHLAGAAKHQFVDRGGDLARMTGLPRATLSVATALLLAGFLASMALGFRVPLRPIALERPRRAAALPQPVSPRETGRPPVVDARPPVATPIAPAAGAAASAATKSSVWQVRATASSIRFHTAWSQGPIDGGFRTWRAKIIFDPAALAEASATITIDAASVFAADGEQQNALPQDDWLSVAAHPMATWHANAFRHLGGDRYRANGTLSLRGVSGPLPLSFTLSIIGNVATMSGQAVIDRTLFGVGQGEWSSTADLPARVTVSIDLKADRLSVQP